MFVRQRQTDEFGTSPYVFLGPATYVTHKGDRPIAITWKLEYGHADRLLQPCVSHGAVTPPRHFEPIRAACGPPPR